MNDMIPIRGIGDNRPPQTLADTLADRYRQFVDAAAETLNAAATAPARIEDDETAGSVAELVKKMREIEKGLESAYNAEKAPHQSTIVQLGGFFITHIEKLERERKRIAAVGKDYAERKAAEKKRRLEEEAARKREEAEKKLREARDAETTATAARTAAAEFDRLEREAQEAKQSAVSEQELASAEVARAEAKLAKVKADNAALAAEFSRRVVDGNPATDEEKAEKRKEADDSLKAARADVEAARTLLAEARERSRLAREAARKAEEEAAAQAAAVKAAERTQKHAQAEADRNDKQAERIESVVAKDEPSLGSTRSLHGALSTTMRVWKHEVTDRNLLDKEALWNLLHDDDISVAVGKWMKLQGPEKRTMPGARFWEEDVAVNR